MPKKNNSVYIPVSATGSVKNILAMWALVDDETRSAPRWYTVAHEDAARLATKHNLSLWTVAQVLSVISPQRRWDTNVRDCELAIIAHSMPMADRIAFLSSHKVAAPSGWSAFKRAWQILDGTRELVLKGGPKTYNFARTIESPDTWLGVVVDSHAVALWSDDYQGAGTYQMPLSVYNRCASDYEDAAAMLGVLPSELQEKTWTKRRELLAE